MTRPDPLARSAAEPLSIEANLSKRGIGLVAASGLNTRNPTGKLMLTILADARPGSARLCWNRRARVSPGAGLHSTAWRTLVPPVIDSGVEF